MLSLTVKTIKAVLDVDAKKALQVEKKIQTEKAKQLKLQGKIKDAQKAQEKALKAQYKLDKNVYGKLKATELLQQRMLKTKHSFIRAQKQGLYFTEKVTNALRSQVAMQAKTLALMGISALGARKLITLASESVKAYEEQNRAVIGMETAMKSMGRYTPEMSKRMQEFASALQGVTNFGDEATLFGVKFLMTFKDITDDLMPRTITAMADFAAFSGKSMQSAANIFGKASMGQIGELTKVGISVDRATFKAEGYAGVLRQIEKQVKGQAVAQRNAGTSQTQLTNAWGDAKEMLGGLIALEVDPFYRDMAKVLGMATKSQIEFNKALKETQRIMLESQIKEIKGELATGKYSADMGGLGADYDISGTPSDERRAQLEAKLLELESRVTALSAPTTPQIPTMADGQTGVPEGTTPQVTGSGATPQGQVGTGAVYGFTQGAMASENVDAYEKTHGITEAEHMSVMEKWRANQKALGVKETEEAQKTAEAKKAIQLQVGQSALNDAKMLLAEAGKENKKAWDAYKAISIAETLVSTYKSAVLSYTSLAPIPIVGPALGAAAASLAVMSGLMRVNMIRQSKPEGKALGGVMDGAGHGGGVTTSPASYIVGDNPSGKELVVPAEGINKDSVEGAYTKDKDSGEPTIINVFTEEQFADVMSKDLPKNTMVNNMVRDSRERGSSYNEAKRVQGGG